jgi:hypothetical protein
MSYEDLLEWQAYDRIEPIGAARDDWHAASICATMWNIAAAQAGMKKHFAPKDFLLEFGKTPEEAAQAAPRQSWQQQRLIGMMMAASAKAEEALKQRRRKR